MCIQSVKRKQIRWRRSAHSRTLLLVTFLAAAPRPHLRRRAAAPASHSLPLTASMLGLRGPSLRQFVLYLWSWLQGARVLWLDRDSDFPLAKLVLTQAPFDKGLGVEEILALPAWDPILSVESVSGPRYAELKANFGKLHSHLPAMAELQDLTRSMTRKAMQQHKDANAALAEPRPFDANDLCQLIVCIFVRWLFGAELFASHFTEQQQQLLVRASWEWRKQIACKGLADPATKAQAISWALSILRASRYATEIFPGNNDGGSDDELRTASRSAHDPIFPGNDGGPDDVANPLVYSVFLQPFILSPMINVSDIAVTWFKHSPPPPALPMQQQMMQAATQQHAKQTSDGSPSAATRSRTHHLLRMISLAHPFPVLERFVSTPITDPTNPGLVLVQANTQVFIALDRLDTGGIKVAEESCSSVGEDQTSSNGSNGSSSNGRASSHSSNGHSRNGSNGSSNSNGSSSGGGHSLTYELAFGLGARSCAGKSIAIGFMLPLFEELDRERSTLLSPSPLSQPADAAELDRDRQRPSASSPLLLQPSLNHRYSGRHNDEQSEGDWKETLGALWYQLRMGASVTWSIIKRGQCCRSGARRSSRSERRGSRSQQISPKQA